MRRDRGRDQLLALKRSSQLYPDEVLGAGGGTSVDPAPPGGAGLSTADPASPPGAGLSTADPVSPPGAGLSDR